MGIFGKKGWDKLSPSTFSQVKELLGEEKFSQLDRVVRHYNFFTQKAFSDEAVTDDLATFFGSAGNQFMMHGHNPDEVELLLQCSLALKRDNNPAHTALALFYGGAGRKDEAKREAKEALEVIKYYEEKAQGLENPAELQSDPRESEKIKELMQQIIQG